MWRDSINRQINQMEGEKMKKLINDLLEVGKDLWACFIWLVQAADELGCIAGTRLAELTRKKRAARLTIAMPSVKRRCIEK